MSPDIINKLVLEAGYEIVKNSLEFDLKVKEVNIYYSRDILMILRLIN